MSAAVTKKVLKCVVLALGLGSEWMVNKLFPGYEKWQSSICSGHTFGKTVACNNLEERCTE